MAVIVKLDEYKAQSLLRDGFAVWRQKFDGPFDAHTCLKDLSAETLCRLAEHGDESVSALYGMIIGFLGYGDLLFDALDRKTQSRVIDIHLFLADHIRFEMMARIGWLAQFKANQFSLFEMVRSWERVKKICLRQPPALSEDHAEYARYQQLIHCDQQVFIRRMLPVALEAFKKANNL